MGLRFNDVNIKISRIKSNKMIMTKQSKMLLYYNVNLRQNKKIKTKQTNRN